MISYLVGVKKKKKSCWPHYESSGEHLPRAFAELSLCMSRILSWAPPQALLMTSQFPHCKEPGSAQSEERAWVQSLFHHTFTLMSPYHNY